MRHQKYFLKDLSAEQKQQIEEKNIQLLEAACHKLLLETAMYRQALIQGKEADFAAEQVALTLDDFEKINIGFRFTIFCLDRPPL